MLTVLSVALSSALVAAVCTVIFATVYKRELKFIRICPLIRRFLTLQVIFRFPPRMFRPFLRGSTLGL